MADGTYVSPPGSARKTSSESERRSHSHKRASSVSDGKRIVIDRPYFGDGLDENDDDEDEADVAFRPDLSGATPVAPENFIRPIARRGSRSEKPIPAFFEVHGSPERPTRPEASSPAPIPPTTPTSSSSAGKRKKKARSNSNATNNPQAAAKVVVSKSKKWSISEFIGVIVLAIFVAAITVALQHSW